MNGDLVIQLSMNDQFTPALKQVGRLMEELFTFPYVDELTGRDPRMTYLEQIAS